MSFHSCTFSINYQATFSVTPAIDCVGCGRGKTVLCNPLQPSLRGLVTHAKIPAQWLRLGFSSWFHVWVESTWQHIIRTKRWALNKTSFCWIRVIGNIILATTTCTVNLSRVFCNYSIAEPCAEKGTTYFLWLLRTFLCGQWLWTQRLHFSQEL